MQSPNKPSKGPKIMDGSQNYSPLSETEKLRFRQDSRYQQRMRVMNIIAGAFFVAAGLYFGLFESGILHKAAGEKPASDLWMVIIPCAVGSAVLSMVIPAVILHKVPVSAGFEAVANQGSAAMTVALAAGEAIVIFGMIGPFLAMPASVSYSLMVGGVVVMGFALSRVRPQIADALVAALARESDKR
ncbi:MAG: hypothetical protein K1X53_10210 [Candidatus Sumerlaeaceae bacterium]|nr:hypothetical protein [Candidatus Sumerlaeaceae bacterium]